MRQQISASVSLEQLVMFAGPPCSGKSTVTERLRAGWAFGCQTLQLETISSWSIVEYLEIWGFVYSYREQAEVLLCDGSLPRKLQDARFIFHYDFLRPRKHPRYRHFEEAAVYLLDRAKEITFVTFWADPEKLRHRMKIRRMQLLRSFLAGKLTPKELIRRMYNNKTAARFFNTTSGLLTIYDEWWALCEAYPAKAHWFVDTTTDKPELSLISKWRELRAQLE